MHISEATFVVTDTETTGAAADADRLIEIGAIKVQGGEIIGEFQQLINPERSVPGRITQLTGISTGMVFDAPVAADVLPEYLDFLGDSILVAHNLPFDERFINKELALLGRPSLGNNTLCTLRLARRLLPGLRSKGLTRLAQFYGIKVNGRHRALGDAAATATILNHFTSQLAFEHEIDTVKELLAFQHRRYQKVREAPSHLKRLRDEVLPDLPDRPGVYFMKSSSGKILYIGKAKSLNNRVRSYFNAIEAHDGRKRKLMAKVRTVTWTETTTELDALILESRLIKEHKPHYNRAQRRYRNRPFIRLDAQAEYPSISFSTNLADDGAEYYGPLRNRKQAEFLVELIARFFRLRECSDERLHLGQRCLYADIDRCTAPCETEDAEAYAEAVERVRAFLVGQDHSIMDELEARMRQAARQLEYEKAAEYRDWQEQLKRVLARQEAVAAPVLEHNAALALPHPDREEAHVVLVRFGRSAETITLPIPLDEADCELLAERVRTHYSGDQVRPDAFTKRDMDEIRLLSHWMYVHRDEITSVSWDRSMSPAAFTERIADCLAGVSAGAM